MKKKGISAIVATVLIILITTVSATIVWTAIIPMISDAMSFSELEYKVSIISYEGYTVYDSSKKLAIVQVKRDVDDSTMKNVRVFFTVNGSSISSSVIAPESGGTMVYTFDLSKYGEPDSVSIAPIFIIGNSEKEGSAISKIKIPKGQIREIKGYTYNIGTDYNDIPAKNETGEVVCILTNAYWSDASVVESTQVNLSVISTNCDGEQIGFVVWEDDVGGNDPVIINPSQAIFVGGVATATWIAEWQNDGVGDPEYYFMATLVSDGSTLKSSNPLLTVTQVSASCGNGINETGEQCDDGNLINGDGCSSTCQIEIVAVCGNNITETGEQCDDGNLINGDGCSSTCQIETAAVCGNNITETGEQCDNGNTNNGVVCAPAYSSSCIYCDNFCVNINVQGAYCGDGNIDSGFEQCDDGNLVNGDGCSNTCQTEAVECNDGIDNDGDTFTDYPNDTGCSSPTDISELGISQCDDGIDNDGDTFVDYPNDPDCTDSLDNDESSPIIVTNWGDTTQQVSVTAVNWFRCMGGTSSNTAGMTVSNISISSGGSGNARFAVYQGGTLSDPNGANLICDAGTATAGAVFVTASCSGESLAANEVTWICVKGNDYTFRVNYDTSVDSSSDFQSARGRWMATGLSIDENVAYPSSISGGGTSFSNYWYSWYLTYES